MGSLFNSFEQELLQAFYTNSILSLFTIDNFEFNEVVFPNFVNNTTVMHENFALVFVN